MSSSALVVIPIQKALLEDDPKVTRHDVYILYMHTYHISIIYIIYTVVKVDGAIEMTKWGE